jgi:hypothetical protein
VSLRAEIHAAFDEIAPSMHGLPERVVQAALTEAPGRRAKARWVFRMRPSVALVAALVLIALVVGTLIGGTLLRDWRNWSNAHPPQINQNELKRLESETLQLPVVLPGDSCPTSPLTNVSGHGGESFMFGKGPVYSSPLGFNATTTDLDTWGSFDLMVDTTKTSGLVLIRAKDLQTKDAVVFVRFPYSAASAAGNGIPTGGKLGTEVILGESEQVYAEEVLDTSRPYPGTKKGEWPIFKSFMGYPKTATGCIGFQIDGDHFTEVVVVSA